MFGRSGLGKANSKESTPSRGSTPPRTSPPRGTMRRASPPRASPPRTSQPRETTPRASPPRASPPSTSPPRTTPPRQTTPPRTTPPRITPPRESTPPPPPGPHAAVYVTVYEYTRILIPGLPRTFMRHSGIIVQPDPSIENFEVYHVIGTPGVGLTYTVVRDWNDPRMETRSLMAMNFVAWIPRQLVRDLEAVLGQARIQISRNWNCQNWVQEGLQKMVEAGFITNQQMQSAVAQQQRVVHMPYAGNSPNRRALD